MIGNSHVIRQEDPPPAWRPHPWVGSGGTHRGCLGSDSRGSKLPVECWLAAAGTCQKGVSPLRPRSRRRSRQRRCPRYKSEIKRHRGSQNTNGVLSDNEDPIIGLAIQSSASLNDTRSHLLLGYTASYRRIGHKQNSRLTRHDSSFTQHASAWRKLYQKPINTERWDPCPSMNCTVH